MSEEPSNGEIYRLCLRIEQKVDKTNGRVDKAEDRIEELEKQHVQIKAYWSAGAIVGGLGLDWLKHKIGL